MVRTWGGLTKPGDQRPGVLWSVPGSAIQTLVRAVLQRRALRLEPPRRPGLRLGLPLRVLLSGSSSVVFGHQPPFSLGLLAQGRL